MRTNLPVTGREYVLGEGVSLVSMTDTKGRITLANADFVAASGYSEAELLGQPHNLVRHPDMPPGAFEDMWATLKAGRPWTGLVKNRRKDGDHYWVVANATPVREGGTVTGYMSVRTRPTREEVDRAEAAYREIREGKAGLGVREGKVVKTAGWRRANPARYFFDRLTLARQFAVLALLVAGALALLAWELGTRMRNDLAVIAKEREGSAVHKPLRDLLAAVQRHRGLAASAAAGDEKARAGLPEALRSVEDAVRAMDGADAAHGAATGTAEAWKAWKAQWAGVAAKGASAPPREVLESHTVAVGSLLELVRRNADGSGLVLDPELDTFNLMDLFALKLPPIAERLALARGSGASLIAQKSGDPAAKRALLVSAEVTGTALADATVAIGSLGRANAESAARLDGPAKAAGAAVKAFALAIERDVVAPREPAIDAAGYFARGTATVEAIYALHDMALAEFDRNIAAREARLKREAIATALVSALLVLVAAVAAFVTLRRVTRRLAATAERFHRIAEGDYTAAIDTTGRDEIAQMLVALKSMQIRLGFEVTRAKRTAEEALRIQQALDCAEMPVRIADGDGRIVYVNHALQRILERDEAAFRAQLPGFEAAKVVGGSIGVFYDDPQAAIARLQALESTVTSRLTLGGRVYDVTTSPVRSPSGEKLGTVGQWADRTEQLAVEREIGEIVEAAARGDFERRVSLEGKQGFFLELSKGLNALLSTTAQGLEEVVRMLGALSRGDLTARIDRDFEGTFARMKEDANATVAKLTEIVGHIQGSADAIGTASRQIAAGNQDLSSRTEEQASSLQQTASSMEQLTSTVKQNAENAKQANQLAASASDIATRGGQVVGQVIDTMGSIQSSSEKIVDIIGVIDGIAFQTNILALNAAVEAARAGEQGRGFAVVASEVRNLAQRSAAAAKEIKSLIGDSVGKVDAGTRLVEAAGKTMDDIVSSVRRVTDIMAEITAASLEQSAGIEQVRQAIVQMDQVTQQNAALVEEAAAAAESMKEQAVGLTEAVGVLRIADERAPGPRPAAIARPKGRAAPRRPAIPAGDADDEWEEI